MDPARWARIQEIFVAAIDLSADDRESFIDRSCAGDPDLKDEVRALLEHHDADPAFLETPIIDTDRVTGPDGAAPADRFVAQYRLVRPLGRGGMGEVFLADRKSVV